MTGKISAAFLGLLMFTAPAIAVQPPQPGTAQRSSAARSAEQWVRQLENELDHLEEDLYYERGTYPAGLRNQIDQASRAAAHFRQILRRNPGQQQLMRSFQDMDRQVHQLVSRLEQSGDAWLQRQAARIRYPDEQLHYVLQTMVDDPQPASRELLARHAHALEREARSLQDLIGRVTRRSDPLRGAVGEFSEAAAHFHQVVEQGAGSRHLHDDFRDIDEAWQNVVDQINRSPHGLYLRRNAQNVNRVHNQIHQLLTATHTPPQTTPPQQVAPPPQAEPPRSRPAIEFEIPGLGRFRIPR